VSTHAKQPPRSIVALHLPTATPALIALAKTIVQRMTHNAGVPNPTPTLAEVDKAIADLEAAETVAQSRLKGAVATRNEKHVQLATLLHVLKASVQRVADAHREAAPGIIESCAMNVKKATLPQKHVFAVKPGAVSGSVTVTAQSAGRRAAYLWEMSTDGGKTWAFLPVTLQAHISVTGLAAGSTVSFRVRSVTKAGEGDRSQPMALTVR
jgi:hypothetical protein